MEAEKLIRITADDGGNDPKQDEILLHLVRETCLTDVSFFVNMSPPSPLVSEFLAVPGLSIGLHIDLTDGKPVARPEDVPTLLTREGNFMNAGQLMKRCLIGGVKPAELTLEVESQIGSFLDRFGRLDHLDSHRHVHRIPRVARAIANALAAAGLSPRIRNLRRCVLLSESCQDIFGKFTYWHSDLRRIPGIFLKIRSQRLFTGAGLNLEDGLITPWPTIRPGMIDAAERWAQAFESAPAGRWEANFHPGWNAAEAALLKDARFREGWTNSLTAPRRTRR